MTLRLIACAALAASWTASAQAQVTGLWATNFGAMHMLEGKDGHVSATFTSRGGRLGGHLTGSTLSGNWYQYDADTKCATAREGTYYWGRFIFQFNADRSKFDGYWGPCDQPLDRGNSWGGIRSGSLEFNASVPYVPGGDAPPPPKVVAAPLAPRPAPAGAARPATPTPAARPGPTVVTAPLAPGRTATPALKPGTPIPIARSSPTPAPTPPAPAAAGYKPCYLDSYANWSAGPCYGTRGSTIFVRIERKLSAAPATLAFQQVVANGVPARVTVPIAGSAAAGTIISVPAPAQLCVGNGGKWTMTLITADGKRQGDSGSFTMRC